MFIRTLKYWGIGLISLMAIILIGILSINLYRAEILESINQKLKTEINGDIHIEELGISLGTVTEVVPGHIQPW